MRDGYVDDREMQTYGEAFVTEAKARASLGPFLATLSRAVATATTALAKVSDNTQTLRTTLSGATPDKNAALAVAEEALTHVSALVKAHEKNVNPKDFFPRGRRAVKRSAAAVVKALELCAKAFKKNASKIPGAAAEQKAAEAAGKALAQSLGKTTSARASAAVASPALVSARARWHSTWRAAKLGTESLLLLESLGQKKPGDVESSMKTFFGDLSGGRPPRSRKPAAVAASGAGAKSGT